MKRIAFILDYLFYAATYQQEIVTGLVTAAAEAGVQLVIFLGGPFVRDPYDPFAGVKNGVYEMITREMFDGIVVCNSAGQYATNEETSRFLSRFAGMPIVFLGNGPSEFSRVEVDNTSAMADLVRHFIDVHRHRTIAFITGPLGNRESQERLAAYRRELGKAGLPYAPELVVSGDFNVEGGREAVRVLLDERRVRFEALVSSNDFMALGAKQELERRGLAVPADVALAGFDDTMDASCTNPGLTTVKQPYEEIGRRALAELGEIGKEERSGREPRVHHVPAETVIRQSCGCFPKRDEYVPVEYPDPVGGEDPGAFFADVNSFYAAHREEFVRRLETVFGAETGKGPRREIEFLLDSILNEILRGTGTPAILSMQKLISYCRDHRLGVEVEHEALSLTRRLFAPALKTPEAIGRAENYLHAARRTISDLQDIEKNQNLLNSLIQTDQISEVGQMLLNTVQSNELAVAVYRTFPRFNINNFLFAEYASPDAKEARLVALIRDGSPRRELENGRFSPRRLFPDAAAWFDVPVVFVLPVVYQENALGYVVIEKIDEQKFANDPRGGVLEGSFFYEKIRALQPIYLTLTRELAKSFYINRLISMRLAAEESLKALTVDLEFRNRELEDFARIASHDLKEPLRKIAYYGDRLVRERSEKAAGSESDYPRRMQQAALRMNDLIEGLLTYSRATSSNQPLVPTDLAAVVAEAIQDLEVRIGETKGRVEVGDLPVVPANPLQMRELFQNLIGNALKYHRRGVPPVVVVRAGRRDEFLEITVEDNGIGFDPKYREKIFGIFQRLVGKNEYEGTGVGLAICKKIAERHNGSITARGEPGKGAVFTVRLRADA